MKICNYIKELQAFCTTYQLGSMSKAAEALYSSQPTISQRIRKLEEVMGTPLFERHGPKLEVTPEGETLHKLSKPLIQGLDSLKIDLQAMCNDLSIGELTIAAAETTLLYLLPRPIEAFVHQYPDVNLTLKNVTGQDCRELVAASEVDFAVSSLLNTPETLEYTPYVSYRSVLITPKNHPLFHKDEITLEDIGQYGLILPPSQFSSWNIIKMVFSLQGVHFKVALEAGGWEVIKQYTAMGLGISITTEICIRDEDRESLEVISLDHIFPSREYGVITKKGKILSPAAQRFIQILKKPPGPPSGHK
jgi:DNA-binding transcriptional LysR family regulator